MDKIRLMDCKYTPCYCEENVWMLCKRIHEIEQHCLDHCLVVFISNGEEMIPLWLQKAGKLSEGFVVWDYHVILVCMNNITSLVYDFDTQLGFPCSFNDYMSHSIKSDDFLQSKFHRWFRVVPGKLYLEKFASDRSHMLNEDLTWKKPPPDYAAIRSKDSSNNLQSFINMDESEGYGNIMNLEEFKLKYEC